MGTFSPLETRFPPGMPNSYARPSFAGFYRVLLLRDANGESLQNKRTLQMHQLTHQQVLLNGDSREKPQAWLLQVTPRNQGLYS